MLKGNIRFFKISSYCVSRSIGLLLHQRYKILRIENTYKFTELMMAESSSQYSSSSNGAFRSGKSSRGFGDREHRRPLQPTTILKNSLKKVVQSKRKWKYTQEGELHIGGKIEGFNFTVMTYNILSQVALQEHSRLYQHCNPEFLTEVYRMPNILSEIIGTNCDVVCLQEMEAEAYTNFFERCFKLIGFQGIYKQRTGNKSDGCCILWREEMFELHSQQPVEFHVENVEILNRDNVGLIVSLRPRDQRASDVLIHFATTHLLFNPRRGDVKLSQLRVLFAELDKMAFIKTVENIRQYHPIILCGDFNIEPDSHLYNFIELCCIPIKLVKSGNLSGQFEGFGRGKLLSAAQLSLESININRESRYVEGEDSYNPQAIFSAYAHSPVEDNFYHSLNFVSAQISETSLSESVPLTSMTGNFPASVDHIFYNLKCDSCEDGSQDFFQDRLRLLGTVDLMTNEDFHVLGGIPNVYLSSDHIYVMSKFLITPQA